MDETKSTAICSSVALLPTWTDWPKRPFLPFFPIHKPQILTYKHIYILLAVQLQKTLIFRWWNAPLRSSGGVAPSSSQVSFEHCSRRGHCDGGSSRYIVWFLFSSHITALFVWCDNSLVHTKSFTPSVKTYVQYFRISFNWFSGFLSGKVSKVLLKSWDLFKISFYSVSLLSSPPCTSSHLLSSPSVSSCSMLCPRTRRWPDPIPVKKTPPKSPSMVLLRAPVTSWDCRRTETPLWDWRCDWSTNYLIFTRKCVWYVSAPQCFSCSL